MDLMEPEKKETLADNWYLRDSGCFQIQLAASFFWNFFLLFFRLQIMFCSSEPLRSALHVFILSFVGLSVRWARA